ncbi:hypothetical protein [Chitinophaga sp.]|uniref:hypothetical protein n=1 Tax=Chitinophaga sp. TaxID=1869181 RepID=UPI002D8097B9|nr:hypothetical protein [Chitinophaga sp.]
MDMHIHPGYTFGWPESPGVTGFALLFIIVMVIVKELCSIAGAPTNVVIRTGKTV